MAKEKVCIAGGHGFLGTNIVNRFMQDGIDICVTADANIDLRDYEQIKRYFDENKPKSVILVAAKHGGISEYEEKPVEYMQDNILIATNTIRAAFDAGVSHLINIGASCVYGNDGGAIYSEDEYDKNCVQKATEPYGLAKLAGMKLCEYYKREYGVTYISVLPVNMYGDGIGYKLDFSNVMNALMKRFHDAKNKNLDSVVLWGDGKNTREFLYVDDFIDALELIMMKKDGACNLYNVGGSESVSIDELAKIIAKVVGYEGKIEHDLSKPNGSSRGVLCVDRIKSLGWTPKVSLQEGVARLYKNYANS